MLIVNLFDQEFDHSYKQHGYYTASEGVKPKLIYYVKNHQEFPGITLFTERGLQFVDMVKSDKKIAWLVESPAVHPWTIDFIKTIENKFDLILTTVPELLKRGPKYVKSVVGSSRVDINDAGVCNKTKLVSMIASKKTQFIGHRLRHEIASNKYNNLDVYGHNYINFENKKDPLKDYMFSIAIMNIESDNYFTEIIVDCLMYGTVPIFYGCKNIGDYFDERGIIKFSSKEELEKILPTLSKEKYESMLPYIKNNFETAKKYVSTDDMIAKILIRELF